MTSLATPLGETAPVRSGAILAGHGFRPTGTAGRGLNPRPDVFQQFVDQPADPSRTIVGDFGRTVKIFPVHGGL